MAIFTLRARDFTDLIYSISIPHIKPTDQIKSINQAIST